MTNTYNSACSPHAQAQSALYTGHSHSTESTVTDVMMWLQVTLALAAAVPALLWLLLGREERGLLPGLPLLGNVIALGRHGVALIGHARGRFGDALTLNLAGQRMTWLFKPAHIGTSDER